MTIRHQRGHLRCTKRKKGPAVWELGTQECLSSTGVNARHEQLLQKISVQIGFKNSWI